MPYLTMPTSKNEQPEGNYLEALKLQFDAVKQLALVNGVVTTAFAGFITALAERDRMNGFVAQHPWCTGLLLLGYGTLTTVGHVWLVFLTDLIPRPGRREFLKSRWAALIYVALFAVSGTLLLWWGIAYHDYVNGNKYVAEMDASHQKHNELIKPVPTP